MFKSKLRQTRKCNLESLENRSMMAGDVQASVVAGDLFLTGDAFGNQIQIHQTSGNFYRVSGDNGTKINGQLARIFRVTGSMNVNLAGGDDTLKMGGIAFQDNVSGNLNVRMGAGKDTVNLGRVTIGGTTTINTEADADRVDLGLLGIYKNVTVLGGTGDDIVNASGFTALDLTINGEAGLDSIDVHSATMSGNVNLLGGTEADTITSRILNAQTYTADTGAGNDLVNLSSLIRASSVRVFTGAQNDQVVLQSVVANGPVTIDTASGNDEVRFTNGLFSGITTIRTGTGNDTVQITGSNTSGVFISTGDGADHVGLLNVVARSQSVNIDTGIDTDQASDTVDINRLKSAKLNVKLGGGNDQFKLKSSTIGAVTADGGAGLDAFFDLLGNDLGSFTKLSFES
jgi:large repetitive protein